MGSYVGTLIIKGTKTSAEPCGSAPLLSFDGRPPFLDVNWLVGVGLAASSCCSNIGWRGEVNHQQWCRENKKSEKEPRLSLWLVLAT